MGKFWVAFLIDSATMPPKKSSSPQGAVLVINTFKIISYPSVKEAKYVLCKWSISLFKNMNTNPMKKTPKNKDICPLYFCWSLQLEHSTHLFSPAIIFFLKFERNKMSTWTTRKLNKWPFKHKKIQNIITFFIEIIWTDNKTHSTSLQDILAEHICTIESLLIIQDIIFCSQGNKLSHRTHCRFWCISCGVRTVYEQAFYRWNVHLCPITDSYDLKNFAFKTYAQLAIQ